MSFDINEFLGSSVNAPMATRPERPEPGTYLARIANVESADDIAKKWIKPPEGGRTWIKFEVPFDIIDEALLAKLGRTKPFRVSSDWRLDVVEGTSTPATGNGKNIDLGRLRAALGQNTPGQPWSFSQLPGAGPVKVTIVHQANKQNPDDPFVKVKGVAAP